ncbi:glycosyltransferase family A protein [uncultured Microbacterium sp.]|uniref:glycosyltransferase family 2 protein n=1 Tax=uncultured Microbacterium sp. TaxID=191216 RepID=UPI0028D24C23|nr:glycosyltransferase family A protein [uncultured Microbacterium sp.]
MADRVVAIVPTYNEDEYIAATLRSLASQHPRPVVVVVDRPGTDGTRETVRRVSAEEAMETVVIEDTVHTMSGARRLAVEFARRNLSPDYFLSMDADTVLPAGWLGEALSAAKAGPYGLVAGEGYFESAFWRSVPHLAAQYARHVGRVFFPQDIYDEHRADPPMFESVFRRFGRPPSDCAMLVSSSALAVTGDIPEDRDENGEVEQGVGWPLMVRLLDAGQAITSIASPMYETSARRLLGDAVALLDSSTYAGVSTESYRHDSDGLRRALDDHADRLDFGQLQEYVVRNYVILACLLRPRLVSVNADLFGEELAGELRAAVLDEGASEDAARNRAPLEVFATARRLTPLFFDRIVAAFERERAW